MSTTSAQPKAAGDKAGKRKAPVRYYRFTNRLKEKAASGLGVTSGEQGSIAMEALEAAEAEFDRMSEDYPDWVQGHIKRLNEHLGHCVKSPDSRHNQFKSLQEIAHDMKGQGGTFGYPLISHFGESLYQFTKPREVYSDDDVEIVKAHIDAMNAVIKGRVKGSGGEIGKELLTSFNAAIKKRTEGST